MSGFEASERTAPAVFVADTASITEDFMSPAAIPAEATQPATPTAETLEQAFQRGFGDGEAAARASMPVAEAARLDSATKALSDAMGAIEERQRGRVFAAPGEIVELALSIAEQLLHQQLGANTEALISRISHAIENMPEREPLIVEVAPEDHETLLASQETIAAFASDSFEIKPLSDLNCGEFRLSAGAAEVDGRLHVLLASIRQALEDECSVEEGSG